MDSLMAALVAALAIRATDRSITIVAAIAERSRRTGATIAGAWLAVIVTQGIAAAAGALAAAHLTSNAAGLLLAVTLLAAGGSAPWPGGPIAAGAVARPFATVAAKLIAGGLGDRTGFVTFAIAAGGVPALAGIGSAIGGGVMVTGAAIAGETLLGRVPRRAAATAIGLALLIAGTWIGFGALRLI